MALTKAQRHFKISKALADNVVLNQTQLVEILAEEGIEVAQTTVSRDLEELGAIKIRIPGDQSCYAIPEMPTNQIAPSDHLKRVLGEWVGEVSVSLNLVVLRTPPGSAHVVASALDRAGLIGVLGTVAGDDTVLLVADENSGGEKIGEMIRDLAGLSSPIEKLKGV
ncbi:MAG: ArgR family transcriptional regulator [Acidimicrobiales bacterium]|nr:ArgR family transcriptional regulator [Acidimicrobiales bacterium]